MRLLYLLCVLLSVPQLLAAQRPGGNGGGGGSILGSIEGAIRDSVSGEPVEFATLLLTKDSTQVDGALTDENGEFRFTEVPLGVYTLEVSFIGYDTRRNAGIELTGQRPDIELGTVPLLPATALLDEVVVTGEAALVENRVDKVVYNASQDVANRGGDGADVLRRVPLLSVDLDGNVSLRGSSQVQILINGRPSSMFAGSVGEALQAMPSDEIEKVEVVTSPGAKYRGEGTAGIINIITKRGGLRGLTGNVSASVGTRSNNVNGNLNYAKGRFGLNGGLGSRFSAGRPTTTSYERFDTLENSALATLNQSGEGKSNWIGLSGNVGAFYDLNAFNAFTTSFRMNGRRRSSDLSETNAYVNPVENLDQVYVTERDNIQPSYNLDWTTDYKRKYQGEDHELNVAFQLGANFDNNDYDLVQDSIRGDFPRIDERGRNRGENLEYTLQADYQRPVNERLFLETGVQGIIRDLSSVYRFENSNFGENIYGVDPTRSNTFDYGQDVYAGYLSSRVTITEKWSGIAGIRYEHTAITGALERPEPGDQPFSNDYGNLLPSGSLQYQFTETSALRASFSRRIQRPGLGFINPFTNSSDRRRIEVGNPELNPEVSNQYEISTNGRLLEGGYFNVGVFYKATEGEIDPFDVILDGGVVRTTFLNIGSSKSYGTNLYGNYDVGEVLKMRLGGNVERLDIVGAGQTAGLERSVWQFDVNGSLTLELPGDYIVEGFGFYRAPRQSLQGQQTSFSIWSIGAQKKLMEDRWRVGVRFVEPFSKYKTFEGETNGKGFYATNERQILFRSFGVNASYRFGSLEGDRARERRSKIDNTDVRDSDGGGDF